MLRLDTAASADDRRLGPCRHRPTGLSAQGFQSLLARRDQVGKVLWWLAQRVSTLLGEGAAVPGVPGCQGDGRRVLAKGGELVAELARAWHSAGVPSRRREVRAIQTRPATTRRLSRH